jgi:hypothetical protein
MESFIRQFFNKEKKEQSIPEQKPIINLIITKYNEKVMDFIKIRCKPNKSIKFTKYNTDDGNILLIINSDKIDMKTHANLGDEIDKCDKINILLTGGFESYTLSVLCMYKHKIDALVVVNSLEWEKYRFYLDFCPKRLFVINDIIDVEKFAYFHTAIFNFI